jgi:hypothetical protein
MSPRRPNGTSRPAGPRMWRLRRGGREQAGAATPSQPGRGDRPAAHRERPTRTAWPTWSRPEGRGAAPGEVDRAGPDGSVSSPRLEVREATGRHRHRPGRRGRTPHGRIGPGIRAGPGATSGAPRTRAGWLGADQGGAAPRGVAPGRPAPRGVAPGRPVPRGVAPGGPVPRAQRRRGSTTGSRQGGAGRVRGPEAQGVGGSWPRWHRGRPADRRSPDRDGTGRWDVSRRASRPIPRQCPCRVIPLEWTEHLAANHVTGSHRLGVGIRRSARRTSSDTVELDRSPPAGSGPPPGA